MTFRTRLDYSSNRQIIQRTETLTHLSGATLFGMPFSGLSSGPNLLTTGYTEEYTFIGSTFSGNSATTVYNWYDSRMSLGEPYLSAITPTTSGITQYTGQIYVQNNTIVVDGNIIALDYSGVSFDVGQIQIYDLGSGNYSGSVDTLVFRVLSAETLDFSGRTIWIDNPEISRTDRLIITNSPQPGYVFTCLDSEGMGGWVPVSGASSGNTYWSASTGTNAIVVINSDSLASGINSLAEGYLTTASGYAAHAEGLGTVASGNYSHAEGANTIASGVYAHTEGDVTTASGNRSHAEGSGVIASGSTSHAEGANTRAFGVSSHAEGQQTTASGDYSHSEGVSTLSSGSGGHAEGSSTTASGSNSHAEGSSTTATGQTAHAEGYLTIAFGDYSHSEGYQTSATTIYSHAEGRSTIASGDNAHAEGYLSVAGGQYSHAEGYDTYADFGAHAEGEQTTASGWSSHAEGRLTTTIGNYSHAEGSNTIASGLTSHAEGQSTTASGISSHAGGDNTVASGSYSFVHGLNSRAAASGTIVLGSNITGSTTDTVYVPDLVIDGLTSQDPIATDANGKIVAGTSDVRLKKNIVDLPSALDVIKNLRGVAFEYTDESNMGSGTRFGFIAQEVQNIVPELVRLRAKGDGMLSLSYTEIIPWVVEAVKELVNTKVITTELILETQTIAAEDNNIELNYNGTKLTAIGGGISITNGISDGVNAEFKLNSDGNWVTNNVIIPTGMVIPTYTPSSTADNYGKTGEITTDADYLYIKTINGWKRSSLQTF